MDVYWLEQNVEQVPSGSEWLGASEMLQLGSLRFSKRRSDWRLGRWTAKCALAILHDHPFTPDALAQIEIRPSHSGAPEVFFASKRTNVTLSISHRCGIAMCAVADATVRLGCDLELIETRSNAFVEDYFTPEEQTLVAQASFTDRTLLTNLLWSAKESALKALRVGLRQDTRSVRVEPQSQPAADDWRPLRVHLRSAACLPGWWRQSGTLLWTVIGEPLSDPPLPLVFPQGKTSFTAELRGESRA